MPGAGDRGIFGGRLEVVIDPGRPGIDLQLLPSRRVPRW